MWIYEKKLQFPIDVRCKDPRFAKTLITQYGGPAGEAFRLPTVSKPAVSPCLPVRPVRSLLILGRRILYRTSENSDKFEIEKYRSICKNERYPISYSNTKSSIERNYLFLILKAKIFGRKFYRVIRVVSFHINF